MSFLDRGRGFMKVVGEWRVCEDGVTRPALRAKILAHDGNHHVEVFLVDSCADRTVFSANLLSRLGFSQTLPPASLSLQGISDVGASHFW